MKRTTFPKPKTGMKKLLCGVVSAAMLTSMIPSAAFATAGADADGGWYTLPDKRTELIHQATDSKGNTYNYSYLSSGIEALAGGFSQSLYYLIGINGVNFDRGLNRQDPHTMTVGEVGGTRTMHTGHTIASNGIMGTDVNQQPDEYLYNAMVSVYENKPFMTKDNTNVLNEVYVSDGTNRGGYDTINVTVNGAEYAMPVVIYQEANLISDTDGEWSKSKSIAEWVVIENQREGRPSTAVYDPYVATLTAGHGMAYSTAETVYSMCKIMDQVTEASRDANGNATLMSRYVDANKTDRTGAKYATALELAQTFEDFNKASQYYMIKQIDAGKVQKKVSAVVCGYQPAKDGKEAAYACRIYDSAVTGENAESNRFGGRLANAVCNISTDINTVLGPNDVAYPAAEGEANKVRWYWASDIVKNCDAVFVCDAPKGNEISTYLAMNPDGERASVYTVDGGGYDATNQNVEPLIQAADRSDARADLFYKFPMHLFGVWYAQGFENCWMAPFACAWMYPDSFASMENVLGWAAKKLWHINEADVSGVMQATSYDLSMPKGATLGVPSANYESAVNALLKEGNEYYLSNVGVRNRIDAMNGGDLRTHDLTMLSNRIAGKTILSFPDLDENAWYMGNDAKFQDGTSYIDYASQNGLMQGVRDASGNVTGFDPSGSLSRAQTAVILYRMATGDTVDGADANDSGLSDVANGAFYTKAVNWAVKNGIVTGYPDKTFGPDNAVTRAELATMMHRFANSQKAADKTLASTDISNYPDAATLQDWQKDGLAFCVGNSIMSGVGGTYLAADTTADRAQAAKMMSILHKNVLPQIKAA